MLKQWFLKIWASLFEDRYLSSNNDARFLYNDAILKYRLGKFEEIINMNISQNDDIRLVVFFYELQAVAKYRLKNKDNSIIKELKKRADEFCILIKQKKFQDAFNLYSAVKLLASEDTKKDYAVVFFKALQSVVQEISLDDWLDTMKAISETSKSILKCDELALFFELIYFQAGLSSPQETYDFMQTVKKENPNCLLIYPLMLHLYWMAIISSEELFEFLNKAIEDGIHYAYLIRCFAHVVSSSDKVYAKEDFEKFKSSFDNFEDCPAIPLIELQQLGVFPT